MPKNLSITLLICLGAGLAAFALLFLPPREVSLPAAAAPAAPSAAAGDTGADSGNAAHAGHSATHNDSATAEALPPVEAGVEVAIVDFAFAVEGTFAPGAEVVVTNLDSAPHTLTSVDGLFDTGMLGAGEQARIVLPDTAGSYAFFCAVHPSMTGTFEVA